jgi:4-amino-4-deoxy-L-arabinose transferase-like glycosyltransferase
MLAAPATTKSHPLHRLLFTPLLIAAVAFIFRLTLLFLLRQRLTGPSMPYVNETTDIAASIAAGRGFASPFPLAHTGATAWVCPLFPYVVAGIFRLWGTFTHSSLLAIQILNCLFASLTVFPIYAAAKRTFGSAAALFSAWVWVFLPFAWWTPIQDIWDTSLTGFLLAAIFWATLAIGRRRDFFSWLAYGALWAAGALVNAAVLSLLPFFFAWLLWQRRNSFSLARPVAALFLFFFLLLPWTIRNHRAFGKWIPLRSNFGVELWLGNNPAAGDPNSFALHPLWNASEAAEFQRAGEINYTAAKQHAALAYIRAHPAGTARAIAARVWSNWFAVTDRVNAQWSTSPAYVRALFLANFFMVLFAALGLIVAPREIGAEALPYWIVVLIFPLPYYLTHTLVRYRFPIEPMVTILAAYGALQLWSWVTGRAPHAPNRSAVLKSAR